MLCQLSVEIGFEAFAVAFGKRHRSGDVEVVEKVCNVKENRVASLFLSLGCIANVDDLRAYLSNTKQLDACPAAM